ncbi:MAG: FHA domain-containing protein [Planctomycetes bacterium]|nr:FHA domain-containing protein [Planctomycetota bacterium]
MESRYSLRFESGERRGETIPISASGFTIGRRPGSSLQVLDNSVSGRHAEFLIDDQGVTVRDLESTNGTRVGEMRILEQRITHGDHVFLGSVEFVLLDEKLGGARTALEALAKTKTVPGPDGLQRVSADLVARSKKVSRPGIVVLVLAVAAGGTWWWLNRGGGGSGPAQKLPEPVAGDLLADEFSFESDHDTWSNAENAPQGFYRTAGARRSGGLGVSTDLAAGEWALYRSRDLHADVGREYVVRAALRADGGARLQVGLEFTRAGDAALAGPGPFVALSEAVAEGGFEEREVVAVAPPGYDVVHAVLLARASAAGGSTAADDASVVERANQTPPAAQVTEYRLLTQGAPATHALLFKGDRVLFSGLEFTRPGATPVWDAVPMEASADGKRIVLAAKGAHEVAVLRCEAPLVAGGIATLGSGADAGFKTHASEFERAGVKDLLLGGKGDFVRFTFDAPVKVVGRAEGAAVRVAIEGLASGKLVLQLEFKEEREAAGNLAYAARNAEKKGELGESLAQWSTLLDTYPYEDALVAEAEAARVRLYAKGLSEVRDVRAESERARFFRLVDLYRQCRDKVLAIGRRYAKSDVEREANALAAEVERDLAGLEADLDRAERARLAAILAVLEAQNATGLAAEVKSYLDARPAPAAAAKD